MPNLRRISRGALRVVVAREFATRSWNADVQKFDVYFSGRAEGGWFIRTDPSYNGKPYEDELRQIEARLRAQYFMTD